MTKQTHNEHDSEDLEALRILTKAAITIILIITTGLTTHQYIIHKYPPTNNNPITDVAQETENNLTEPNQTKE